MFLGIDTGGTFTDFVLITNNQDTLQVVTHKVLSTPQAPEQAILQGIKELGLEQPIQHASVKITHGSTVATNAALEDKGVRTAFITNRGFKDLLSIARQTRPQLYSLHVPPLNPPVPTELCLEVGGRINANGDTIEELSENDIDLLITQLEKLKPQSIAINLLFSFLDEQHESRLQDTLQKALGSSVFITRSSDVLPEYREYERGIATWLNASLSPLVKNYLLSLQNAVKPRPLSVMQSTGGTMLADEAAERAVNLLLSGPAGGLAAAHFLAQLCGYSTLITFDMGGTSTDVALIEGEISLSSEGSIGPYPVAIPMVDMHTIGAGGGSIASMDEGRLLKVGPESAGAFPGPACYGGGGDKPTVTDANVFLGRLPETIQLGGGKNPDKHKANESIKDLADKLALTSIECAEGIIALANEHMARALRVISVEKGHEPADYRLCCFGGAGGLHICALAEALNMDKALVPIHSGVLSALGMIAAPVQRHASRSHLRNLDSLNEGDKESISTVLASLEKQAKLALQQEGLDSSLLIIHFSADVRYQGQSSWINVDWQNTEQAAKAFHVAHKKRYGHALNQAVELVNLRVLIKGSNTIEAMPLCREGEPSMPETHARVQGYTNAVPIYERKKLAKSQSIHGPALIIEATSTIMIDAPWRALVDAWGNLQLDKAK